MDSNFPKARKTHLCLGCLEQIESGEKYVVHTHLDGPDFVRTKLHIACNDLLGKQGIDEFLPGELKEFFV
jgi:hypothetical protein